MRVRGLVSTVLCGVIAACGVAPQPESIKTVAAFEVPLPTEGDRDEFLVVLRTAAEAEGLHVDSESKGDRQAEATVSPTFETTMKAAVWRGANDEEAVASAMDFHDHLGRIWLMFSRGQDPALTNRFRERAMAEITRRWPDTLSLPIMPSGAIPNPQDMIRTPAGYIVKPSEAHRYQGQEERH